MNSDSLLHKLNLTFHIHHRSEKSVACSKKLQTHLSSTAVNNSIAVINHFTINIKLITFNNIKVN